MEFRVKCQLAEMLGDDNKWFCSKYYGKMIDDPDTLIRYYVDNGGADDFARRFREAMSLDNRYFCSKSRGCDTRDPQILWDYYMANASFPVTIAC